MRGWTQLVQYGESGLGRFPGRRCTREHEGVSDGTDTQGRGKFLGNRPCGGVMEVFSHDYLWTDLKINILP